MSDATLWSERYQGKIANMTPLDQALVEAFVSSFGFREPILEIGARRVRREGGASAGLERLFPGARVLGTDLQPGTGVDCVMNGAQLAVREGTIGTVVTVSTLEHIWDIQGTLASINRALSDDGAVIMTSHMDKSIHAFPSDFWRFTPQAFAELLAAFPFMLVGFQGRAKQPVNVFGIGLRQRPVDAFVRANRFRVRLERAITSMKTDLLLSQRIQRMRRMMLWRLFGSKSSYQALRDEFTIGWQMFPTDGNPGE